MKEYNGEKGVRDREGGGAGMGMFEALGETKETGD